MCHEYMHKTPLKLLSSTFSPLPPVLSLSLSPCLPCFASELAAAALPPRLPLELADAAAPRSSRTSLPPGARGLRAHRRPWSSRPPPWLAGRTREPCAAATELAGLARAATEEVVKLPHYLATTSAPTQPLLGKHDGGGVARGSCAGGGGGARDPHTRRGSMARSSRADGGVGARGPHTRRGGVARGSRLRGGPSSRMGRGRQEGVVPLLAAS